MHTKRRTLLRRGQGWCALFSVINIFYNKWRYTAQWLHSQGANGIQLHHGKWAQILKQTNGCKRIFFFFVM
jgi:hypothetical protein